MSHCLVSVGVAEMVGVERNIIGGGGGVRVISGSSLRGTTKAVDGGVGLLGRS